VQAQKVRTADKASGKTRRDQGIGLTRERIYFGGQVFGPEMRVKIRVEDLETTIEDLLMQPVLNH